MDANPRACSAELVIALALISIAFAAWSSFVTIELILAIIAAIAATHPQHVLLLLYKSPVCDVGGSS